MRTILKGTLLLVLLLSAACVSNSSLTVATPQQLVASSSAPTATHTEVPTATMTATVTSTATPQPTATPTQAPTPIGGVSPKIAFYAKDTQGNIGLYAGKLYTTSATLLASIDSTLKNIEWNPVKWSPDGEQIAFISRNSQVGKALFVYDFANQSSHDVLRLNGNQDISDIRWSSDGKEMVFYLIAGGRGSEYVLNLDNRSLKSIEKSDFATWKNGPLCLQQAVKKELWFKFSYPQCAYPEMDFFTSYDEKSDKLLQVSSDGTNEKTIATFEKDPSINPLWNGFLTLSISPDHTAALMQGDVNGGGQWIFLIRFSDIPYDIPQSELDKVKNISPDQQYLFAWSQDSQNYLISKGLFFYQPPEGVTGDEAKYYTDILSKTWMIGIINAKTNEEVYQYTLPEGLQPLIRQTQGYSGFDLIW